jgi:hypothetical protein
MMPDMMTRADRGLPPSKLDLVRAAWAEGDRRAATIMAAKFQDLGDQRGAILSAREAYLRPDFQRQLGRDPVALIAAGHEALRERYGL